MEPAIVLMTRIPVPGHTKTRLLQRLTGDECAALHQAFLSDLLATVGDLGWPVYLCYTGSCQQKADRKTCLEEEFGLASGSLDEVVLVEQEGQDLGDRMRHALHKALLDHEKALVIGSDLPDLSSQILREAGEHLDRYDVVIGPAVDGGYYLLGEKDDHPYLFENIPWGTDQAFTETAAVARNQGLSVGILEVKRDLDTWEDLEDFDRRAGADSGLAALKTAQCLREILGLHQ